VLRLEFHPAIFDELNEAYGWYEDKQKGLGDDFLDALEDAYLMIQTMPRAWPLAEYGMSKFLMKRFTYSIIYALREERILVVAVMHQCRKPGYWQDRLNRP